MTKIVPIENMRRIEAAADASGLTYDMMMENAGRATSERALHMLQNHQQANIVILVGIGNNGGDGLVAARYLAQNNHINTHCYLLKPRAKKDDNFKAIQELSVPVTVVKDDDNYCILRDLLGQADLVIDALFGIGIRLPIKGKAAELLQIINQELLNRKNTLPEETSMYPANPTIPTMTSQVRVLAVDCPSGLDCDTGKIDKNAIPANETITFIAAKPGLLTAPGLDIVGELSVAPIRVPAELAEMQESSWNLVTARSVHRLLPQRSASSHKGTHGKALIIAGSTNYTGAPGMAAEGAYRAGTGLVTVGAPGPVISTLAARMAEPTWLLLPHDMGVISENAVPLVLEHIEDYQALLLGPGWGQEDTTGDFLKKLLEKADRPSKAQKKRRAIGFNLQQPEKEPDDAGDSTALPSLVIDADGLNLLGKIDEWWTLLPENTIITPHPGEMGRLTKKGISDIQQNRLEIAEQYAREWDVVLVLKGAHTVIAAPDGQVAVLPFKTDALATAGTGDVLAGLIVGMLAQRFDAFDAAVAGGYVHGLAGKLAKHRQGSGRSVISGDILGMLADAWRIIEAN
jgi:ADP-dependent NAD(P)H-hydrate dehydratase / NAD(P)H-hydrate epimerase